MGDEMIDTGIHGPHAHIHDGIVTPLDIMVERRGNPRSSVTLIKSMAEMGQRVAVKARHLPGGTVEYYEGSRRVATARYLGWTHIGVQFTDDLTDEEVDRLRLVYGNGAEPLSELDEGAGYAHLQDTYRHSVASIAATVGRPVEEVRQRLALHALPDAFKALLRDGKVYPKGALYLGRLTAPGAVQAVVELIERDYALRGEPVADVTVRSHCHKHMLRLESACFDIKSPDLGFCPCTECPKRSGRQLALMGMQDPSGESCTDYECWTAKQDAWWVRATTKVGHVIADGAKVVNASGPIPGCGYVAAKEMGPDTYAARDKEGRTHLLVKQARPEVRVTANTTPAQISAPAESAPKASTAKPAEMKAADRQAMLDRCFTRIKEDPSVGAGLVVKAASALAWAEHLEEVCQERGLEGKDPPGDRLAAVAVSLKAEEALYLLLDVLATGSDDALKAADAWKGPERPKMEPPKAKRTKAKK